MSRVYRTTPSELAEITSEEILAAIHRVRLLPLYVNSTATIPEFLNYPRANATVLYALGVDRPTASVQQVPDGPTDVRYVIDPGLAEPTHHNEDRIVFYMHEFHQDGYVAPGTVAERFDDAWSFWRVDGQWSHEYNEAHSYATEAEARQAASEHLQRNAGAEAAEQYAAEHGLGDE